MGIGRDQLGIVSRRRHGLAGRDGRRMLGVRWGVVGQAGIRENERQRELRLRRGKYAHSIGDFNLGCDPG